MTRYRKKPVEIEAFKWTANISQDEDPNWIKQALREGKVSFSKNWNNELRMDIETLEGLISANIGDYIIQGIKGEIYPCKPDIFELTYELCI